MKQLNCKYIFRAKLVIRNLLTTELDFIQTEKIFENQNLILARESAFSYYDNFIHGLLLAQGLNEHETENISDREIRKVLNPIIDPKTSSKYVVGTKEVELPDYFGNGIWIIFQIENEEKIIHFISNDNSDMPQPPNLIDLEYEYQFYERQGLDIKNYKTSILYFDVDEYNDGYEENAVENHQILNTPFDWNGYSKKGWWDKTNIEQKKDEEQIHSRSIYFKYIIEQGESQQVEFKPTLLFHFEKQAYSKAVRHIIAKTICSFLNSKGGYLFIGVTDNKQIQGLNYDFSISRPESKDPKDYFRLEVDKIIREYFKEFASNISGDFENIDGVEIFVITVYPSKIFPCFIKGINGKEFYVRLTTSSEPYYDVEEIVRYCLTNWNSLM